MCRVDDHLHTGHPRIGQQIVDGVAQHRAVADRLILLGRRATEAVAAAGGHDQAKGARCWGRGQGHGGASG